MSSNDDNFFEKFGCEVKEAEVEVGQSYPIYGMITKIIDDTLDNFTIEVNSYIQLKCQLNNVESIEKIKERSFEAGIFVTTVTSLGPIRGDCTTIIFGKKQAIEV